MDILDLALQSRDFEWLKEIMDLKKEKIDYDKNYIKNTKFESAKNEKGEYYIVSKEVNNKDIKKPNMTELEKAMDSFMTNILGLSNMPKNKFNLGETVMTLYGYVGVIEDIGINKKYLVKYNNEFKKEFESAWFLEDELDLCNDLDIKITLESLDDEEEILTSKELKNNLSQVADSTQIFFDIEGEFVAIKAMKYYEPDNDITKKGVLVFLSEHPYEEKDDENIEENIPKEMIMYLSEVLSHDEYLRGDRYNEIDDKVIIATSRIKEEIKIYLEYNGIDNPNFVIKEFKDEDGRYIIFVDEKLENNKQIERYVFTNFRFTDTWREE